MQLANARVDVVDVLLPRLVLDHVVEGIDELGGDARLVAEVVHAVPTLVDAVAKLGDEEFARALTRAGESGRAHDVHELCVIISRHPRRDVAPTTLHRFSDEHARTRGFNDDAAAATTAGDELHAGADFGNVIRLAASWYDLDANFRLPLYIHCAAMPNSAALCMASVRTCTSSGAPSGPSTAVCRER